MKTILSAFCSLLSVLVQGGGGMYNACGVFGATEMNTREDQGD